MKVCVGSEEIENEFMEMAKRVVVRHLNDPIHAFTVPSQSIHIIDVRFILRLVGKNCRGVTLDVLETKSELL